MDDTYVLTNVAAYRKWNPIYEAEQMPKTLEWNRMDQEWLCSIRTKFWSTEFRGNLARQVPHAKSGNRAAVQHLKEILVLRDKLLSFGGDQACMPRIEEDLHNIMIRGGGSSGMEIS